jgi:hypothetical protein
MSGDNREDLYGLKSVEKKKIFHGLMRDGDIIFRLPQPTARKNTLEFSKEIIVYVEKTIIS